MPKLKGKGRKRLKRKRILQSRLKHHGTKSSCKLHIKRVPKKVIEKLPKKSWWRRFIEWIF